MAEMSSTEQWLAYAIGLFGPLKISLLHPDSGYVWQVEPVDQDSEVKRSVCCAELDQALENLCGETPC